MDVRRFLRQATIQSERQLFENAYRFLNDSVTTDGRIDVSKIAAAVLKSSVIEAEEGQRQAAERMLFKRHRGLAVQVKQRDGYLCQICGFDFRRVYPGITARYAEAHHIVPLAKMKRRHRVTAEDLITVCSNCHEMLHAKLPTVRGSIGQLRRAVRRSGYAASLRQLRSSGRS